MKKVSLTRKAVGLGLTILFALSLMPTASAGGADTLTTNDFVPFTLAVFVPCANDGSGEIVLASGTLHVQNHITINDNRATIKEHFQPQGIGGVGLTTGDTYRATGETQQIQTVSANNGSFEATFVNNFKIIGQGPGNNFLVHENFHVTVNANGDVTTTVDNISTECQ